MPVGHSFARMAIHPPVSGSVARRSVVPDIPRSPGRPLEEPVRTEMEARLGASFADVRVHDDAAAQRSAAGLGARAYTYGSDIVVGRGATDKHTLAHELTHVVQQRRGPVAGKDRGHGVKVSDGSDRFEREAEAHATRAMASAVPTSHPATERSASEIPRPQGPIAIQRYELDESQTWRISENRKMAVPEAGETKEFYAVEEIIETANTALQAGGSPLTLAADGEAPGALAELGMLKVKPTMKNHLGATQEGDRLFNDNECIEVAKQITGDKQSYAIFRPTDGGNAVARKQNPSDPIDISLYPRFLAQPDATPATLNDQMSQSDEMYRFIWKGSNGELVQVDTASAREALTVLTEGGMLDEAARGLLNRMRESGLENYPALQQDLVNRSGEYLEDAQLDKVQVKNALSPIAEQVKTIPDTRYGPYEGLDREEGLAMARKFGVNQFAAPKVGEAFAVFSTRSRSPQETKAAAEESATEPWTYHFAAVVARDGDDSVTLENYNRRNAHEGDKDYYFRMYGLRDNQSFHDVHKSTVTGAVTLAMGDAPVG